MQSDDPFTTDDALTDEDRLENDRLLRERGINPHELSQTEKDDLIDDMRSDGVGDTVDDDDKLSDVVPADEQDGND